MWTEILNKDKRGFFIKYVTNNNLIIFYTTNFVEMWEANYSVEKLSSAIQGDNPLLEADSESLVTYSLEKIFTGLSQDKVEANIDLQKDDKSNRISLIFNTRNDSFPLKLTLQLNSSNSESFCKEITIPLLTRLKEVQASEEQLMDIILKKDIEISEYKAEGAILPLKHLETKTFNEYEHNNMYKATKDIILPPHNISSSLQLLNDFFRVEENTNLTEENLHTTTNETKVESIKDNLPDPVVNGPHVSCNNVQPKIEDIVPKTENKIVTRRKGTKRPLNF